MLVILLSSVNTTWPFVRSLLQTMVEKTYMLKTLKDVFLRGPQKAWAPRQKERIKDACPKWVRHERKDPRLKESIAKEKEKEIKKCEKIFIKG